MIELLDPRKIEATAPHLWAHAGWSYRLDYSWLIQQAAGAPRCGLILDAGCGVLPCSPLGQFIGHGLGAHCVGVDRLFGNPFDQYVPSEPPGVIFWASSLEHNEPAKMRELYLRSMDMLMPGGLFLATITIGRTGFWFGPSANSVLKPCEAAELFDDDKCEGDFEDVWEAYRLDDDIRARYTQRYGEWNQWSPSFIIAGVRKVK